MRAPEMSILQGAAAGAPSPDVPPEYLQALQALHGLLSIDDSLIDWILSASPSGPNPDDQRQKMQQVLAAKSDVEKALNTLVAYRLKLAATALTADAATLQRIADGMASADRSIATVQSILDYAGQAVTIASSVIAKVALIPV
jgi:hypothetical protein